jgi:type II secretory pathway pseudopilin PulG
MNVKISSQAARGGFSLLEVLVSCGILVVGLASIASILPAATARLREAATADRAGSMAAAALAEFECRDLAFRELFLISSGSFMPAHQAVVFGQVLRSVPGAVAITSGSSTIFQLQSSGSTQLTRRIDTTSGDANRGFFLEDELQFNTGGGAAPLNVFTNGMREFRRNVCWGAMVEPYPWGTIPSGTVAPPMRAVRATIAVFRKPGAVQQMLLTGSAGGVFRIAGGTVTTGTTLADDSMRKRFLAPCAPVLAVAQSGTAAPQWLTINSSWPQWAAGVDPQTTRPTFYGVVFREPGTMYQALAPSGTLQLIGFENIQSITQQTFSIE